MLGMINLGAYRGNYRMALKIRDEDSLGLIAAKYILSELVFAPIDALVELVDNRSLSIPAGHSAILAILNSVPEFIARCHGEKGKLPAMTKWGLRGTKYLYVYGICRLDVLADISMNLSFKDYAGFLYTYLRCELAHALVSGRVLFFADRQINQMSFAYYYEDLQEELNVQNISEIAHFACYVPNLYHRVKRGVEKYMKNVEEGKEEFHLENAHREAWHSPGFTEWVTNRKGHVFLIEKVKEYWPDHFLNK